MKNSGPGIRYGLGAGTALYFHSVDGRRALRGNDNLM